MNGMNATATGDFIRELRKEISLTQKELAEKLNCTDKAVSRWETGKGFPDVEYLLRLSELFQVNVNELLLGQRIEQERLDEVSSGLILDTISVSRKKIHKYKIIVFILLCLLLLCAYYLPLAIMTPSDVMGVIFFHVLAVLMLGFFTGFLDFKFKWLFPIWCFATYCPMTLFFGDIQLLMYAAFFLFAGYIPLLLSTGISMAFKRIIARCKKK